MPKTQLDVRAGCLTSQVPNIATAQSVVGFQAFAWGEWFMSPGFGGLAAVIAAAVAFGGVGHTVKAQRETNRKQQWWERARWALDLTLSEDSTSRTVGFEVLDALGCSEYATEHEVEVIAAAVLPTLEAYGEMTGHDLDEDDDGGPPGPEAHLSQDDDQEGSS
jgi:hypothetical protein